MKRLVPILLLLAAPAMAQETNYHEPPAALRDLLLAPPTPRVSLAGNGQTLAILAVQDFPTVAELSQPELRLAGLRLNPRTNGPSRASYAVGLSFKQLPGGAEKPVTGLPAQARISSPSWSPDSRTLAFALTTPAAEGQAGKVELWVADVATGIARRLLATPLNDAFGSSFEWVSNSLTLLARTVPAGRGTAPAADASPTGPAVQETGGGRKSGARTYQDLLKTPADERLFDYYATAQLVKVQLADGAAQPLGQPGVLRTTSPSPDGRYVLVRAVHKPYSYTLPVSSFPQRLDVLDLSSGQVVKTVADLPLADNVPTNFDAVPTGPREHAWRTDAPATLYYAEAQDGGDPKKTAPVRDKVYLLPAPFSGPAQELAALPLRYAGMSWGTDHLALADGYRWADRHETTWQLDPASTGQPLQVLFDGSSQDTYHNPGTPYLHRNAQGRPVLALGAGGQSIYLFGQGASPEGDRPFVDELNLQTKQTTRRWRSEAPYYEVPVALVETTKKTPELLTRREAVDQVPNYYLRPLASKGKSLALTYFANPYAKFGGSFRKQVLHYKRADGVDLTANLYLPPGYKKTDGPLPTLMEAYPVEFKDKANAGQVSGSPYSFTRVSWASPVFWVTQGYAVLENATVPIVGEGSAEPNDTYTEQLVSSAKAAIDEGQRLGVVDPSRVAVMGHSYGAFMTANLLAHSSLFKAGIARSGAYNRTLTPYGFQGEERTYWQAKGVYDAMSPFNFADKIKTPILLIHGEADNNSGTFPIQSERFYAALKGQGATARYVVLPAEAHSYAARENLLHMLWEMDTWLDKYVKHGEDKPAQ
ncbi:prolyl oligopeptidase family serine peptidase [Hymenobacter sp. RP-2-7]|uniref:Prolyl oligopeptidase family serine peptidase n=1 Tax=Hymenobacter polaris TaxID=2682546 RepID=A0A7Y0FKJ8_9BACT|nr:prolyl oligopeptidase family serine peptidase [Hymenobacter polaris]NML63615.1 prolyl oligopeptidase family serine peptidase [Hymenobacter polaris]